MERAFFFSVRNNAIEEIAKMFAEIASNPEVATDLTRLRDEFGRTAVEIAVDNGSLEAAELLLDHGVPVGSALLYAVDRENIEAVELLLDWEASSIDAVSGSLEHEMENFAFSPDMTPVKMAAIRNNYDILKLLLERGFPVPSPDDYPWTTIQNSRAWLTAYRAMSSPSFILLTSSDPFRSSFRTAKTLRENCWKREGDRAELEELADQCETFACELLDEVRDSDELETILEFNHGEAANKGVKTTLEIAVDWKQKKFVSHTMCFEYAMQLYIGDVNYLFGGKTFHQLPMWQLVLFIVTTAILYPVLCILHIMAPNTKLGRLANIPVIHGKFRFLSVLALLTALLVEALIYGVSPEQIDKIVQNIPTPGLQLLWTQVFIFIWMSGFLLEQVNKVWYKGVSSYFKRFWDLLDLIGMTLYITYVTLRLFIFVQWKSYSDNDLSFDWAARARFNSFQPVMVADALFAIFTLTVFLRAMYFLGTSRHLGCLQISFGRMVMDIIKFIVFLWLIGLAFACGLNKLYWFYGSVHDYLCDKYSQSNLKAVGCSVSHGYGSLSSTAQTLFWTKFGMAKLSMLSLKPGTSPVEELQIHDQPVFTEVVGTVMYALYMVVSTIVLFNLLVAIMTTSYQMTEDNKGMEWAYSFVKDALSYLHARGNMTLPPPFNLLLMLKNGLVCLFSPPSRVIAEELNTELSKSSGLLRYRKVIDKLVKRYRLRKERGKTE